MTTHVVAGHAWHQADATVFRQTWQTIQDTLVACGMVRTADTGQIDLAATTNPGGWGAGSPPMVFRMDDSLQATKPVYVILRSYSSPDQSQSGYWNLGIIVCTGTDGASNPTGLQTSNAVLSLGEYGIYSGNAVETWAWGDIDKSRLVACFHGYSTSQEQGFLFSIERTRDANGAIDGEGVLIGVHTGISNQARFSLLDYSFIFPTNGHSPSLGYGFQRGNRVPLLSGSPAKSTLVDGNNVGPLIPLVGGFVPGTALYRQGSMIYGLPTADMAAGNIFSMTHYGVLKQFRNISYGTVLDSWSNYNLGNASRVMNRGATYSAVIPWD